MMSDRKHIPETKDKTAEAVIVDNADSGDVEQPPVKDITQSRGRKVGRVLVMLFAALAVVVATLTIVKKLQSSSHKPMVSSDEAQPTHAPNPY